MRQSTFTPRSNFKAKRILLCAKRTGDGSIAGSGLSQVRTLRPPIERGGDSWAGSVLKLLATPVAARGPRRELGHHTVPRARDEARLFRGGLRGEVLTDLTHNHGSVQLLDAAHRAMLPAVLGRHTVCGPRPGGARGRGSQATALPVGNLPLEEASVPVTDAEAASFLRGSAVLITVRRVARPPRRVEAPEAAALASAGPAGSRAPSPGACGQKRQRARLLQHPRPPATQKQASLSTSRHKQGETVRFENKI